MIHFKLISNIICFLRDPDGNQLPKDIINNITVFRRKQKRGNIDVWWLYDDGGIKNRSAINSLEKIV